MTAVTETEDRLIAFCKEIPTVLVAARGPTNFARMTRAQVTVGLALVATSAQAQARTPVARPALYDIPPFHSQIQFSVPFMGLSSVKGAFEEFGGTMFIDPERPESSAVVIAIEAASIHTGIAQRDKHLRSSDFFDVERFPVIAFRSERIARTADGYVAHGSLKMHGVTRPIALPFKLRHAPVHDENGLDYAGFDAEVTLNWRDFGIAATNEHNSWFQPTKMLVNDSVRVSIAIEAEHRVRFDKPTPALTRAAFDSAAAEIKVRMKPPR